jgi:hypothetical protein
MQDDDVGSKQLLAAATPMIWKVAQNEFLRVQKFVLLLN